MNKLQYELLLKQKEKLKNEYYASFFWIIIDIIILYYFGILGLSFIIIISIFIALLKQTPYQIKKQIEEVDFKLAGYKQTPTKIELNEDKSNNNNRKEESRGLFKQMSDELKHAFRK